MDSLRRNATTSGYPKWVEGARYFMQFSGVPDTVYNYTESKNDYIDDYASRGQWVNWLAGGSSANPKEKGQNIPVTLSLAFHTDAGNIKKDSIVGTLAIYTDFDNDKDTVYPNGASQSKSRDYCDYMQTQIVEDVRALYAPEWTRRMLHNSSYSEARVPKVPAVLLELLSHQNFADMRYGVFGTTVAGEELQRRDRGRQRAAQLDARFRPAGGLGRAKLLRGLYPCG